QSRRRQAIERNNVSRKRHASSRVGRGQAVLTQIATCARPRGIQATRPHQIARNRLCKRRAVLLPLALIIAEEEQLVLLDRSTHRSTKLPPQSLGEKSVRHRIWILVGKRIACLESVAAAKAEGGPVEAVATGFRLRCDNPGNRLPKLCVVVLAGDLGFGYGIERRIDHDNPEDRVAIVGPIQLEASTTKGLAVDFGLQAVLRIFAGGVCP